MAEQDEGSDPRDQLARAAASGDRRALDQLVAGSFDDSYAVCRRIMAGPDDALDVTQEALIAVVRGIGTFDGRSRYSTWLYRIATNACLMELRKRRRRPVGVELTIEPATPVSGPEERAIAHLDVDRALVALPEEFRVVLVLREIEDMEYDEIARALDVPVGTVRSRLNRARRAMLELLGNSEATDGIGGDDD